MNRHSPKTAALLAYDADLLSPAGAARIARHLAGCEACRAELAAIRAYETLRREASAQRWREPDWAAMEARLRREAREVAGAVRRERAGARHALWGGFAAAAAVLALVTGGALWPAEAAPTERPDAAALAAAREGAPREARVMLVAGHATADERPLTLDATVREGALVATFPRSTVHLRLADGTGFLLGDETRVTLARSRERATQLTLEQGRVTSRVAPLDAGARYEVRAGDWVFTVRGTRFAVAHLAGGVVTLSVADGTVDVRDAEGTVTSVTGPGRWNSSPDTVAVHPSVLVAPVGLDAKARDWPALRVPRLEGLRGLEIDGLALPIAGTIAMRASPGTHRGVSFALSGAPTRFEFEVSPEGSSLDPTLAGAPEPDAAPSHGVLAPSAVRAVVARGMDGLQRCYRTALLRRPDLTGQMTLRAWVAPSGRVTRATLSATTPLPWLSTCVENQARRWSFPPPGGVESLALDVPLDFASD